MKYLISSLLGLFVFYSAFALGVDMNAPKTIKSDKIEYDLKSEEMKTAGNTEITNTTGQTIKLNNATFSKDASCFSDKRN